MSGSESLKELDDLIESTLLMRSPDYKERFRAEHMQVKIRADRLERMLYRWAIGELQFEPTCPRFLLMRQLRVMREYQEVLEDRAKIEGVSLAKHE